MNTITLGPVECFDPPEGGKPTNEMTLCTGASRYGVGRFLVKRSDYDLLLQNLDSNGQALLTMSSQLVGQGLDLWSTVAFDVIIAGCVPYSVAVGDSTANDLVEVIVYDQRFYNNVPLDGAFNVELPDLSGFYASTLYGGATQYAWAQVIAALGFTLSLGPNLNLPAWAPRNLVFDQVPTSRVFDALCATMRAVAGYSPYTNAYSAYTSGLSGGNNDELFAQLATSGVTPVKISGRASSRTLTKSPGQFNVVFKIVDPAATDPYEQRYYTKVIPSVGAAECVYTVAVGDYTANWDGAAVSNSTELDAVAQDIFDRELARFEISPDEATYAGWHPFVLDGRVRVIRWSNTRQGAFTTVRINTDRDFSPLEDTRRSIEALSNQAVLGLGNAQTVLALSGARMTLPVVGGGGTVSPSNFAILVKSNGSDGSGPLYDLYTLADTGYATKLNLAGALSPKCSRARWQSAVAITAAADGSVGSAFYGTTGVIQLFDCPETLCTSA